ncbi:MAG: ABC transporter permease subunit [Lentisphaeria bacterium]|nr:ABC transporter permease subunit [Lentisphaeria bacterium]NQZ68691.1 ABC transporter permease subunit [Lentisphaeria bacterium]
MDHLQYFVKRILLIIPTFIGITFLCLLITQFVPGGPIEQQIAKMRGIGGEGGKNTGASQRMTEERIEEMKKVYGFDKPITHQYWNWLYHGKMGMTSKSYKYKKDSVWKVIREKFSISLTFGLTGFFLSYLICIPLGISKAIREGSVFDVSSSVIIFIGYAIPAFAFGMILKMFFCGTIESFWDIFPVAGFQSQMYEQMGIGDKLLDRVKHMFLPILCYMIGSFAVLTLLMKNSLLEEVGKDYIRTVLARGGSHRQAIWGHALRNSLIPISTGLGGVFTLMFAGSVLIEKVFEIPGMGLLSLDAILSHDYMVFMGITALTSILGLVGNVFSDFIYVIVDPRINFQK